MLDINYFRAIQGNTNIDDAVDGKIKSERNRLKKVLRKSINYKKYVLCNGKPTEIVFAPNSNISYKSEIIAFPYNKISIGDVFLIDGNYWLVVGVNLTNPIQQIGEAWLCNHLFRFQNYSSKILEYWGVIDDGSYSSDIEGNNQIQYLNNKINIYLPYNDDTKYLYVDKRLATNSIYDKEGNNILEVYTITGRNQPRNSNGHLLILNAKSGQYSKEKDSLNEMICDYIPEKENINPIIPNEELLNCEIKGRSTIRTGGKNTYVAMFFDRKGNIDNSVMPIWSVNNDNIGVKINIMSGNAEISVEDNDEIVGSIIELSCTDSDKKYITAKFEIEVI